MSQYQFFVISQRNQFRVRSFERGFRLCLFVLKNHIPPPILPLPDPIRLMKFIILKRRHDRVIVFV